MRGMQVASSGGCARLEHQPRGLQVIKVRDALQQAVMLRAIEESWPRGFFFLKRKSQHGEASAFGWAGPVSHPDQLVIVSVTSETPPRSATAGGSSAAFQTRGLRWWKRIRAGSHRVLLRASYKARVFSGKATM